jgi:heme/copper-type cytochrome/quinol oxidase subunit 3
MRKTLRFVHLIGLVLFLGSILTFIVASSVPATGDVASLVVARRVISAGTNVLTLPGLGLLIASGIGLTWGRLRLRDHRWLQVMALAAALIALNGLLFVLPAVRSASALIEESRSFGILTEAYTRAYVAESTAGGVNVILGLVAMVAGVVGARRGLEGYA